jgi:hypothetical protein
MTYYNCAVFAWLTLGRSLRHICLTGHHLFLGTQPALAQIFNKSLVRYGSPFFYLLSGEKCSGEESMEASSPKGPSGSCGLRRSGTNLTSKGAQFA